MRKLIKIAIVLVIVLALLFGAVTLVMFLNTWSAGPPSKVEEENALLTKKFKEATGLTIEQIFESTDGAFYGLHEVGIKSDSGKIITSIAPQNVYWNLSGMVMTKVTAEDAASAMSKVCSIYLTAGMIAEGQNAPKTEVLKKGTVLTEVLKDKSAMSSGEDELDEALIKTMFPNIVDIRSAKRAEVNYEVVYKNLKIKMSYLFLVTLDGVLVAETVCNASVNQFVAHLETVL